MPYRKNGKVCGCVLPAGLHGGSKIKPIFTPTSKAETGHDKPMNIRKVRSTFGLMPEKLSMYVYSKISEYAGRRGIIFADSKFEFGIGRDERLILADEVGTPDSSRFWDAKEWKAALSEGKSPAGYDKEPVRQWGKTIETPFFFDIHHGPIIGINNLDPENLDHVDFVHNLTVPESIIKETTERYETIASRLVI